MIDPGNLKIKTNSIKLYKIKSQSPNWIQQFVYWLFRITTENKIWCSLKIYPIDKINYYRVCDLITVNKKGDKFLIEEFGKDEQGDYFLAKSIRYFIEEPQIDNFIKLYGNAHGENCQNRSSQ